MTEISANSTTQSNAGTNFSMPRFSYISGGILIVLMLAATIYITVAPEKTVNSKIDYIPLL